MHSALQNRDAIQRRSSAQHLSCTIRSYEILSVRSHDVRGTLASTSLDSLQLASKFGAEDFEHEPVGILVYKGPVKVEHYELLSR
jgi:hypothetical protein